MQVRPKWLDINKIQDRQCSNACSKHIGQCWYAGWSMFKCSFVNNAVKNKPYSLWLMNAFLVMMWE